MRNQQHARSARRTGFTLIEMLVATTLVLMIMLIISQALASASKTATTLRTAGALQERARTGITLLRKDLASDKFGPPYGSARGGPKVSDQRLDQSGWQPPFSGYFEFRQLGDGPLGNLTSILEPLNAPKTDGEGITSTRAVNHKLRFTVRLPDGPQTDLFSAAFHPTLTSRSDVNSFVNSQSILYSRWAEVAYWLEATGESTSIANPGVAMPTFTLRRRVRLLAPANVDIPMPKATALTIIVSCATNFPNVMTPIITAGPDANGNVNLRMPGPESLNGPDVDLTPTIINPASLPQYVQRLPWFPILLNGVPDGEDIVMTDVLSFDVKAAWFNNATFNSFVENSSPPPARFAPTQVSQNVISPANMDEPFSDIYWSSVLQPGQGRVFDTGLRTIPGDPRQPPIDPADQDQMSSFLTPNFGTVPNRINVRALQIKIRIWDPRAEQARQVTIVQEI